MSAPPPVRSVIFTKSTLYTLIGLGIIVHEVFFVPPAAFRLVAFIGGLLLAGVPGVEVARALWPGGAPQVEPSSPLPTSPPPPSGSGTSPSTSGGA